MPTYIYVCKRCARSFERFQNITDKPVRTCPECRGRVERLITGGAGVLFKGSGFYSTDYRSERYKADAKKERGVEHGAGATSDKKKGEGSE